MVYQDKHHTNVCETLAQSKGPTRIKEDRCSLDSRCETTNETKNTIVVLKGLHI